MSGAGREAAGRVCEADGGNASLNCPRLVFLPAVSRTARLRRAAGRRVRRAFQ